MKKDDFDPGTLIIGCIVLTVFFGAVFPEISMSQFQEVMVSLSLIALVSLGVYRSGMRSEATLLEISVFMLARVIIWICDLASVIVAVSIYLIVEAIDGLSGGAQ